MNRFSMRWGDAIALRNDPESLLGGKTWLAMRSELGFADGRDVAVGYRFKVDGPLAEPNQSLSEANRDGVGTLPARVVIETTFTNRRGDDCGSRRLKFLRQDFGPYLVDYSDVGDLLRLISFCAMNNR